MIIGKANVVENTNRIYILNLIGYAGHNPLFLASNARTLTISVYRNSNDASCITF